MAEVWDGRTAVRAKGEQLLAAMERAPEPALFSKKGAYGRLMEWSMRDEAFKTQLFRFVDVLPALESSTEVVQHLQEYLGEKAVELHPALKAGLGAAGWAPGLIAGPVRQQVESMARLFVAGEGPDDLVRLLRERAKAGLAVTIDLLGERVVSEAEADEFLARNLDVLRTVSAAVAKDGPGGFSDATRRGPLPRVNLSVKISGLTPELHPADPEGGIERLKERLRLILREAARVGALINFDMESYGYKQLTLDLFRSIFAEAEFAEQPACGIALQAYLREAEADLRGLIAWARERRRPLTVRLVKGAYWDYETILAAQRGWPSPVWTRKAETDLCFERLSVLLLENADLVHPAFGTHNVRSCARILAEAGRLGLDPRDFEFQALLGMADELKSALRGLGYRVREYAPIGELLPGMAYFVRRLLENTSNEGFIRARASGRATTDDLLADPAEVLARAPVPAAGPAAAPGFRNAPNLDFTLPEPRRGFRAALAAVRAAGPVRHPLRLAGRAAETGEWWTSTNPARPDEVLGHWAVAGPAEADAAVAAARAAFPAWRRTPVEERTAVLERAADAIESRRLELGARLVLEAGKPWIEADAEVSEAVDFCRFYAAEMRRLARGEVTQRVPGEDNRLAWTPRGVGVVIAPWNFPLAILCGMAVAPLVAGNCVLLKPAEQTGVIGAVLADLLLAAGAPPGTVQLVSGRGEVVGAHLTAHPGIDFVVFTGSRAVGLRIWEAAGRTLPGQGTLRRVVCEMGGKNALIIDADADLDEAVPGALYSAFGYAGQKCSALSRLIVVGPRPERVVDRLAAAAASLAVGDPAAPGTVVGPLIDAEARARVEGWIERGRAEARVAFAGRVPSGGGHFVAPVIFDGVGPDSPLAREEIFGPVLAVLRARDLDEAFALANRTDYALTGGIYSRSPRAIARAREELLVGNLYINRPITGAIVERHPFGGFRFSGGGTKAGGRGYVENFLFPRAVSENTLRRGFVPPEDGP